MIRWGRAAALAMVAILVSGATPQPATPADAPIPVATPTPNFSPYPDLDQLGCYWATDHDAADLCAQWQAARAAQQAANSAGTSNFLSTLALIISVIGTALLVGTLVQANLALAESRKAAQAAEDSVRETRRIGEAQTRCYLTIDEVKVAVYPPDHNLNVEFVLHNVGQSTALNLNWTVFLRYSVLGRPDRDSPELSSGRPAVAVGPGKGFPLAPTVISHPLNPAELAHLGGSGPIGVAIRIVVTATDVFRKEVSLESRHAGAVWDLSKVFPLTQLGETHHLPE